MFSGEASCRPADASPRPADEQAAPLVAAVRAALEFGIPVRCRLRPLTAETRTNGARLHGAELHAMPSICPTVDPIGRGRMIAGGAALRNLELAVASLGHRPVVRLLPDGGAPLHLATVLANGRSPDPVDVRLHRAIPLRQGQRSFSTRPVGPALRLRLHEAASRHGVLALPMGGDQVRTVGTVLAEAASNRRAGEEHLADVARWLAEHAGSAHSTALIDLLGRGLLLLVTTASDQPSEWIRAGWAVQNGLLTAASNGLAATVVGGVLDAPGVRSALTVRLRLPGCPQVLLHAGWPDPR